MDQAWVDDMAREVAAIMKRARTLESKAQDFPALTCNLKRVRASLRMLELNLGVAGREDEGK